jgi:hypothetical protein
MINEDTRQTLNEQTMKDIGRVLGFFNAYSKLQTGTAAYHSRYSAASLCSPKFLKKSKDALDPQSSALEEEDCRCLYMDGWNVGQKQGTLAFETQNLDMIGEIARLAGLVAPFYTDYTTAENDARDCRVRDEVRTHFITQWRETGGDRRKQAGV